ncbi:alginate O-acetyltransferase AlgX-related protein [Phaeovulum sp. W22_SRMD_FR3]|uniref:alginate O-acetyltransferase AlgX-related protein n=1 Tax=Phaeovulum sp. W22_SRMD_FR3 TaxID=3240274 RepID=UPI003F986E29
MWTKYSGVSLLVVMAIIGGASLVQADLKPILSADIVDGETQQRLERAFEAAVIVRDPAIAAWSALRYSVFGEVAKGVVVGRNGWLFSDEEYQIDVTFEDRLATSLAEILAVRDVLDERGIALQVALLPDKARMASAEVVTARAARIEGRYDLALNELRRGGIALPDLRAALSTVSPGFLRTDTHWTPEGAQTVAATLCSAAPLLSEDHAPFTTTVTGFADRTGDLLNFIPLGPFTDELGLLPERVAIYTSARADADALDLFGETAPPIALVGTSYSAIEDWHFADFLKSACQADVVNYALEGQGPFEPMRRFLRQLDTAETVPNVVLWEIPERYLTVEAVQK